MNEDRCNGKVKHHNKWDAEKHRKQNKRRGKKSVKLTVYRCTACGYWHIGQCLE